MPDLTLAQRFGTDVSFDPATKVMAIDLNNLNSITVSGVDVGLDVSAMTDENKDEYASRIIWALLQLSKQNQPENNTDESVGIYVNNQGRSNATRNGIAQIGYRELVTGYREDTNGLVLDPDDIGSNEFGSDGF